jgi:hypothetical protein
MKQLTRSLWIGAAIASMGLVAQTAQAQRMSGEPLIRALQDGGYVLVMRQAPAAVPTGQAGGGGRGGFGGGGRGGRGGAPVDTGPRPPELTQDSLNLLIGARHAFWYFKIPVDAIYTSPAGPAAQHAGEVPFAAITEVAELDEGSAGSGWLATKLKEMPMAGSNTIIVTHAANISRDLGTSNVAEGETLIVRPGATPAVVGRMNLREWSVQAIELDP